MFILFDDDKDDYKSFIERLKEYLNVDSDIFDAEFYIFPSTDLGKKFGLDPNEDKGFKISYHYEKGMDQPDIKIHGNVDEEKVKDYIKKMNYMKNNPKFREYVKKAQARQKQTQQKTKKAFDAKDLSLRSPETEIEASESDLLKMREPIAEIHNFENTFQLILEVPGIKENDVFISLNDEQKTLTFSAENKNRRYHKKIHLPCKASLLNDSLSLSNGILTFECEKK
ncbi:MAG: hypothetical protein BAJALOKI3v1_140013 [Promethearchaeota archaeon]|nr:MAG: hypothetical protein BAJALOKI3v1_140013 [Candidatus Lokiarchaeota archaeon]